MSKKYSVKCQHDKGHTKYSDGKTLFFFDKNSIYVLCRSKGCKRWSRVQFSFPGVALDFGKAAIVQTLMPENYHFDVSAVAEIVGE